MLSMMLMDLATTAFKYSLWNMGVFATPYNKRTKYHQGRIKEYIGL